MDLNEKQMQEVNRRVALIDRVRARRMGVAFAPMSATERGLYEEALKLANFKGDLRDKSDDYVRGLFDCEYPPIEEKKDQRQQRQPDRYAAPSRSLTDPLAQLRGDAPPDRADWQSPLSIPASNSAVSLPRAGTYVPDWKKPLSYPGKN